MSAIHETRLTVDFEQQQRLAARLRKERLEQAQREAERAAAEHRRLMAVQEARRRAEERFRQQQLAEANERAAHLQEAARRDHSRIESQLRAHGEWSEQQEQKLAQIDDDVRQVQAQTAAVESGLGQIDVALGEARGRLTMARSELKARLDEAAGVERSLHAEHKALLRSAEVAQKTLGQLDRLTEDTALRTLKDEALQRAITEASDELRSANDEIARASQRLSAVMLDASVTPAALVVLQAMEESGFRMEAPEKAGSDTAWFHDAETNHRLGVRLAAEKLAAAGAPATFRLLFETSGMKGPGCLDLLETIELTINNSELARVERDSGTRTVYPKPDGACVLVPPPIVTPPVPAAHSSPKVKA